MKPSVVRRMARLPNTVGRKFLAVCDFAGRARMVRFRMSSPARNEMDVDAFLVWAEGREGRWELRDGQPVLMSPERAAHALTKYAAQKALEAGIVRAGLPCRMFPDGMTVRVTSRTAYEPDALVVCPPPTDLNTMEIPNPVIVVEVLSPSTAADDHEVKLDGYFALPSVRITSFSTTTAAL